MPSLNSGLSIYPSGFDLNAPSGSTMFYVYDEVRDPFTGNVTSSGSEIIGVQVNTAYTSINNIEQVLGLNPQGVYSTVADRILATESVSGSQAFVKKVGDSMSGNLLMVSGAVISTSYIVSPSGLSWSGAGAFILENSGPVTINSAATVINSSGSATIDTGQLLTIRAGSGLNNVLTITSGSATFFQTILPSGLINIGAASNPIDILYVNSLSGAAVSLLFPSGSFLSLSGGVLSGNTTFSGASILTAESGTGDIGSFAFPFSGVYAKTGYFTSISGMSPINILSELVLSSGISPQTSGTLSLGSSDFPFISANISTVTTNAVIISGVSFNPSSVVQASGGTVTGNLSLASGATIVNAVSGVNDLGSQAAPFSNIWAASLNGNSSVRFRFNELLNPVSPSGYTFVSAPSGATVIDTMTMAGVTGVARYLIPTTHYTISGSLLTLTTGFSASGSLYSPFYIY
jgi:hypothetical protein